MRLRILIIIFFNLVNIQQAKPRIILELTDQWKHNDLIYGHFFNAHIDADGDLVAMFFRNGIKIANKKSIVDLAKFGQGPGEISAWITMCDFENNIADVESYGKIQIFEKKGGKYIWKKNIWREEKGCTHLLRAVLFFKDKWFMAGPVELFSDRNRSDIYFLRIYQENGKFIKNLIKNNYTEKKRYNLMAYYITHTGNEILYMSEYEPKVFIVSLDSLNVSKSFEIKMPDFYKKMPEYFYSAKIKEFKLLNKNLQVWKTSYSRITNIMVIKKYLLVQIRTCDPNLKRFALLFYNLKDYNLENVIYIDDLLMASKDNRLYCFENGNPSLDDEAEDFNINIYFLKEVK